MTARRPGLVLLFAMFVAVVAILQKPRAASGVGTPTSNRISCRRGRRESRVWFRSSQRDTGVEHALTVQKGGSMQMRAGGEGGIAEMHVVRGLFAHTHPPDNFKGFNPSAADMSALEELGQQQSMILWHGGIYQFGPQGLLP